MLFAQISWLLNFHERYTELKLDTKKAKVKVKKPTDETVESLEIGKKCSNIIVTQFKIFI